ncbi:MAG: hypothetical protein KAT16_11665, partial [Candidatus Heimdallarchaeota archaeon]|nr:hypothetical protein [Candidatus Heimdallarchaeota archaeon]
MSSFVDLADFGMEYARDQGASYSEARLIDGHRIVFIMQNGYIISGSESPWQGIGFRVLINGGLSFVSVDKLTKIAVKNAIDVGMKLAKNSNPKEKIDFGEPVSNEAKWKVPAKESLRDVTQETIITKLQELDKIAENNGISTRVQVFEAQSSTKYLVTSEGTKIEAEISMLKFFGILTAKGILDSEQRFVDLTRSAGWEGTKTWIEEYENECGRISKVAAQTDHRLTGKIDFVVSPEVTGIICHENCGHPSEGDRILGREGAQAGESFWRDLKLGESRV